MGTNFVNEFQVKGDEKFNLKNYTTEYKGKITKEEGEILLQKEKEIFGFYLTNHPWSGKKKVYVL